VVLTETHTHRKLRGHENVVRVVGYCVVGDQKQIAMEYCAYGNLHECIQNVKRNAGGRGLGRAARRKTEKGRELEAAMRSTRRSRGTPSALLLLLLLL
jgi:serine/threonine protein kinase